MKTISAKTMSVTTAEILATIQTIANIQAAFIRISTTILVIVGNIGEALSILVFAQRVFRNNSCAIYLFAASCGRLIFIDSLILFDGLSFGNFLCFHLFAQYSSD